jgi:hypothetical protein
MGFNPRADWVHATSPIPRVTLRLEQLKEARVQARNAMIKAQQSWVKHRDTPKYKEGDQVWLEGKNLRINQPTAKLAPRRHGPFKIIQVMSAVNYRLELPTQWNIHPVFHIDLLTPYRETIMHGPNFTRPTPELIDGEEEYSVEKILDSQHFGRRRCLQYLVKWEGYPDADNMWVDKDDVFADDKVREFKTSNPDAATHIRGTSFAKSPYPPTTTRSKLLHHHTLSYMSSDGNDDLAYEYPAGAIADSPIPLSQEHPINTPVSVPIPIVDFTTMQPLNAVAPVFSPRPVTASSSASDVATMFRQLRVHTPAPLTPNGQRAANQANETFIVSFAPAERRGDQASTSVESGAAGGPTTPVGAPTTAAPRSRAHSYDSAADDDLRRCARCGEQQEYCHGHTPIIPNPSLDLPPNPPRITVSGSVPSDSVARFNSVVRRPRRWQLASSTASTKTTKMPLRFRQPTTMGRSSRGSLPKDLASRLTSLPKGWVYATEEVGAAVKAEVTNPSQYLMPDAPLTRSQLKSVSQLDNPHRRHRRASSITEALPSSHSTSATNTAVKRRRVTSALILTPQTPL